MPRIKRHIGRTVAIPSSRSTYSDTYGHAHGNGAARYAHFYTQADRHQYADARCNVHTFANSHGHRDEHVHAYQVAQSNSKPFGNEYGYPDANVVANAVFHPGRFHDPSRLAYRHQQPNGLAFAIPFPVSIALTFSHALAIPIPVSNPYADTYQRNSSLLKFILHFLAGR